MIMIFFLGNFKYVIGSQIKSIYLVVVSYFVYVFFKCIYVYWYEARFSFQIRFMLYNSYMTGVISRVGISYSLEARDTSLV